MNEEKDKNQEKNEEITEEEKLLKDLEEELSSILEERKKRQNPLILFFNIGLHKNFYIHLILILLTNIFSLSTVLGIIKFGEITSVPYYLIGIVLFTLIETLFKIITFRFFHQIVFRSFGAINLIYLTPLYYYAITVLGKIVFTGVFEYLTIFGCFLVLRLAIIYYIKKISFRG